MKKILLFLFAIIASVTSAQIDGHYLGWSPFGNTLGNNTSFLGSTDNRSLHLKTYTSSNKSDFKIDSLGNVTITPDTTSGGYNPNGVGLELRGSYQNNAYILASCKNIAAFRLKNTATNFTWHIQNQTFGGGVCGLDGIGIGATSNPAQSFFAITKRGKVTFQPFRSNVYTTALTIDTTGIVNFATTTATTNTGGSMYWTSGLNGWTFSGNHNAGTTYHTSWTNTITSLSLYMPEVIGAAYGIQAVSNNTTGIGISPNGTQVFGVSINSVVSTKPMNIGSGTAPTAILQLAAGGTSTPALKFTTQTAPTTKTGGEVWYNSTTGLTTAGSNTTNTNYLLTFLDNSSNQLGGFTNEGHFAIGATNPIAATLRISALHTGGSTATGIFMQGTIASDVTSAMRAIFVQPSYTATSASVGSYVGVSSALPTVGTNTLSSLIYFQAGGSPISTAVTGTVSAFTGAVTQQSGGASYFNFFAANNAPSYFGAGGVYGIATNTLVGPGIIGEYISSLVAVGSQVTFTNTTAMNITTISLTAGDWDVEGNVNFDETAATITLREAGINTTSATLPSDGSEVYNSNLTTVATEKNSITISRKRIALNATTTVYLVAQANFSAGGVGGYGTLTARRVR